MKNLINIVHPYTYSVVEDDGTDYKVLDFLEKSLDYGAKVINYGEFRDSSFRSILVDVGLKMDMVFGKIFKDERIDSYLTLGNGLPRIEKRPKRINYELWKEMEGSVISGSDLLSKTEDFQNLFFIGGIFERCLGNFAAYLAENTQDKSLFCVKDLCVSFLPEEAKKMEQELLKRNVQMINSEEALRLL